MSDLGITKQTYHLYNTSDNRLTDTDSIISSTHVNLYHGFLEFNVFYLLQND